MNERMQRTGGGETEDEDEKGEETEKERGREKVEISIKSVIIANGSIQQSISISRCGGREQTEKRGDGRLKRERGRTSAQIVCSWIYGDCYCYCSGERNTEYGVIYKAEDTKKKEFRKPEQSEWRSWSPGGGAESLVSGFGEIQNAARILPEKTRRMNRYHDI